MGGFDQAFKLIGGNHGYAFTTTATYDDDFPVFGNFITQPGKVCPSVCIGCFQHFPLPYELYWITVQYSADFGKKIFNDVSNLSGANLIASFACFSSTARLP
jgi:hypothetical protein